MKRVLFGAVGGALAVVLYRRTYSKAYARGITDGMDICKNVLDAYIKVKVDDTVEEKKDEEES